MQMNEKLQQAIAAARNGQSKEAQLLLTQALKENSEETQAWFLLSTLVESKQKKLVYLGKVLALDPQHSKAQQMLARLQETKESVAEEEETAVSPTPEPEPEEEPILPSPVSVDSADYLAQEKGDTVPDWLADEAGLEWEEMPSMEDSLELDEITAIEDVPDWLQEGVSDTWSEEPKAEVEADEVETAVSLPEETEPIAAAPVPNPAGDKPQKQQVAFLNRILIALITVAIIISGILIYLIWQML
jgi:hypothetical protein